MPQYGVAAASKPQNPEAGGNGLGVVVDVVDVVVVYVLTPPDLAPVYSNRLGEPGLASFTKPFPAK